MQIQLGQSLVSADGTRVGTVKHLVLDPDMREVKCVIVERGVFLKLDLEVPIELLETSPDAAVRIRLDDEAIQRLRRFDRSRYTSPPPGYVVGGFPSGALLFPAPYPGPWVAGAGGAPAAVPPVIGWPRDEAAEQARADWLDRDLANAVIEAGDEVFTRDGVQMGSVETVAFDASTGRPIRLVVRRGFLRAQSVELTGEHIAAVDDGMVVLAMDAHEFYRFMRDGMRQAA